MGEKHRRAMQATGGPFETRPLLKWVLLIALLLTPLSAVAYLDPTTGSMVISAIIGLFASLVLAIRTYWYRLKGLFGRKPVETDSDEQGGR